MSIDALQEKIRKLKNPSMVDLTVLPEQLPAVVTEGRGELDAYAQFCRQIMAALKGTVPAVRFSFDHFALLDGLPVLKDLLNEATQEGFYVVLEAPQNLLHYFELLPLHPSMSPHESCHSLFQRLQLSRQFIAQCSLIICNLKS